MANGNSSAVLTPAFPVERRINPFKPELRSAESGGPSRIVGYASVYNKLSRKLPGGFVERVNPGTFSRSQEEGWPGVVCRFNHNDDFLLGTIAGGTLRLNLDREGLYYDDLPPTFRSDIMELMQRGDVTGASFAFRNIEGGDDWRLSDFGLPLRTLLGLELIDVAPVTTPAYPDATSAARSVDGAVMSLAAKFHADPVEIRSLFDDNQAVKLFKRTDQVLKPSARSIEETETSLEEAPKMSGQNAAFYEEELRKDFSAADRKKLAAKGHAMPDGSFPIEDEDDLHNAVKLAGNASDPAAAKAHIKKRAAALGKSDAIPDTWDGASEKKSAEDEDAEVRADTAPAKSEENSDDDEEDPDNEGNGTEESGRSSAEEPEEERAAKATYGDLETCGECGSVNQFGKHCTNCGKPMNPDTPMPGKFCPNCGNKTDGKRSEHECGVEAREVPAEEVHQPEGTSDNGHTVNSGAEQRRLLNELLGKRYDPYIDQD